MALKTRIVGISLLLGVAAVILVVVSPFHLHALNPGPMIRGHESVSCLSCHEAAPGTPRQQIQAKLAYLIGFRRSSAPFGFNGPRSSQCTKCHVRPDDAHPLHRFNEPRFAEAVREISANTCLGCHSEHKGARVSSGGEFCAACHDDLTLKDDPLDVSHRALVADKRWSTCLGCHDYHGNHARKAQNRLADALDVAVISAYLAGGPDPYGQPKRHPAQSGSQ